MKGDHVSPTLVRERARSLRRTMTPAEQVLWRALRSRQDGFNACRQVPLGPHILDSALVSAGFVIQLNGDTHATVQGRRRDATSDAWLPSQGRRVVHFTNADATGNPGGVLATITAQVRS